jgi:hypothetical protein
MSDDKHNQTLRHYNSGEGMSAEADAVQYQAHNNPISPTSFSKQRSAVVCIGPSLSCVPMCIHCVAF